MSETFGRRRPAPYAAAPAAPRPEPETPAPKGGWTPVVDPEFEAWSKARTVTRWKTWGMCGLIVVGGPMSLIMPEGIGQWAGWALTGVGLAGFLAKFRKPAATEPRADA
jgi:hypothetical protein